MPDDKLLVIAHWHCRFCRASWRVKTDEWKVTDAPMLANRSHRCGDRDDQVGVAELIGYTYCSERSWEETF